MSSIKTNWTKVSNQSPFKDKVTFDQLVFRKPFTEISKDPRLQGKTVFFTGVANKVGIIVWKHTDSLGFVRYKIVAISHCMRSAAMRIYELAKKRGETDILFSFIQAPVSQHQKLLQTLKTQYKKLPLDSHYKKLLPWVKNSITTRPPLKLFTFRPVFIEKPFGKQWSFLEYDKRSGVYILRKKIEGKKKVVHVGQSVERMSEVLRNHFYRNSHVNYYLDVHLDIYDVAVIEVPVSLCRNKDQLQSKVKNLERLLKSYYLNGADQLQLTDPIESYKPIDIDVTF